MWKCAHNIRLLPPSSNKTPTQFKNIFFWAKIKCLHGLKSWRNTLGDRLTNVSIVGGSCSWYLHLTKNLSSFWKADSTFTFRRTSFSDGLLYKYARFVMGFKKMPRPPVERLNERETEIFLICWISTYQKKYLKTQGAIVSMRGR